MDDESISEFGWKLLDSVNMAEDARSPADLLSKDTTEGETRERNEFDATLCKAETVVVYLDRAEVCRSLRASVKKGENEILVKKLSPCVDKDSVR